MISSYQMCFEFDWLVYKIQCSCDLSVSTVVTHVAVKYLYLFRIVTFLVHFLQTLVVNQYKIQSDRNLSCAERIEIEINLFFFLPLSLFLSENRMKFFESKEKLIDIRVVCFYLNDLWMVENVNIEYSLTPPKIDGHPILDGHPLYKY